MAYLLALLLVNYIDIPALGTTSHRHGVDNEPAAQSESKTMLVSVLVSITVYSSHSDSYSHSHSRFLLSVLLNKE